MQQGRELPSQQKNACVLLGETGTIRGGGPSCGAPGGSGEWTLGRGTAVTIIANKLPHQFHELLSPEHVL